MPLLPCNVRSVVESIDVLSKNIECVDALLRMILSPPVAPLFSGPRIVVV